MSSGCVLYSAYCCIHVCSDGREEWLLPTTMRLNEKLITEVASVVTLINVSIPADKHLYNHHTVKEEENFLSTKRL